MANKNTDDLEKRIAELEAKLASSADSAIERAIEKALPVAVMAATSVLKPPAPPPAPIRVERNEVCTACGQAKIACKGAHRQAIVYPKNEMFEDLFPGFRLNGVNYLSPNKYTPITVPADSDIENQVAQWEERELINVKGRKKQRRSASFNVTQGEAWTNPEPVGF